MCLSPPASPLASPPRLYPRLSPASPPAPPLLPPLLPPLHTRLFHWCQATLDALGIDLDYTTDVMATNAGGIFELYIHGFTTLVILRPSLGSSAYLAHLRHGPQATALLVRAVHNQMLCVGRYLSSVATCGGRINAITPTIHPHPNP